MEFNVESMCQRIIQWANINTGSLNVQGLEQLSRLITAAFAELNCEHKVYSLEPFQVLNAQGNLENLKLGPLLSFQKRPAAPNQILLVGHMDTVFDTAHPFQKAQRQNSDKIIGPGVTDMKAGICIMLEALKAFEATVHSGNMGWQVLINPDEEIGSPGSAKFLEQAAKKHQLGLIFEPAMDVEGTLAGERKGSAKYSILAKGKAAHAGRDFHLGKNAIVALANLIQKMNHLNGQRDEVTLNVGYISGGTAVNIVPEKALAKIDVRFKHLEDGYWVQEQLESFIQESEKEEKINFVLHGGISRKPKVMTAQTQSLYEVVAKLGKALGQHIIWKNSGGCSDGNNLSAVGLPNVDTLGVCGGDIHSDREFMLVNSLAPRAQLTFSILKYFSEN